MQGIIEQLAHDAGITVAEASCIFDSFCDQLVCKVPALKPVIDAVFENAEDAALKTHINKMIVNLQQQQVKEIFGNWIIPREQLIVHWEESKELF